MKTIFFGLTIILFSIISCKKSVSPANNPKEQINDSSDYKARKYSIDTLNSSINWTGYKIQNDLNLNEFGTLNFNNGYIILDNGQLIGGYFTANLLSIKVDSEPNTLLKQKLITILKEKSIFNTSSFPKATFKIDTIEKIPGTSDFNSMIEGILTIKNKSKNISFKANLRKEKDKYLINTEKFYLDRKDFDISYPELKNATINDTFDLQINIQTPVK